MDWQGTIFRWASYQAGGTGVVLFALGLLYAFFGFRFARFLLAGSAAMVGALAGGQLGGLLGVSPAVVSLTAAAALGVAALRRAQVGLVVASGATLGAASYYLATQLGLPFTARWVAALVAGGLGVMFAWLNRRGMPLVVTTLQGVALMIVGFVSASSALLPSLGATFLAWAAGWSLLVPVLFAMLCVTAYAYQTNMRQGDIRSGV